MIEAADDVPPYRLPDMAVLGPIVETCLKMPEHKHLVENDARIEWLMRMDPKIKQGRYIAGTAYMPKVNGELSDMFEWMLSQMFGAMPDFLVVLDAAVWEEYDAQQREILVFHELSHCVHAEDQYGAPKYTREGLPVFAIKGHDVEEFVATVARYGAYSPTLVEFITAATDGPEKLL